MPGEPENPHRPLGQRWMPGEIVGVHEPCHRCKYDLIGLTIGKPCPECGEPVGAGLWMGERPALTDRVLLDSRIRALKIVRACAICPIVSVILLFLMMFVTGVQNREWLISMLFWSSLACSVLPSIVSSLAWLLVVREEAGAGPEQAKFRFRVRAWCLIALGLLPVVATLTIFQQTIAGSSDTLFFIAALLWGAVAGAGLLGWFTRMKFLRWMCERAGDQCAIRLVRRAETVISVLLTVSGLTAGLTYVVALLVYHHALGAVQTALHQVHHPSTDNTRA